MADEVVPFRRSRRELPAHHQSLHRRTKQAPAGARELTAQQAGAAREGYARAVNAQVEERLLREGVPVPARITMALDMGGHEGPEIDIACGAVEPAVDLWECGVEVPTAEQVKLLAELTGFPVPWFYKPITPGPLVGNGGLTICWTDSRGCQRTEQDYVDERGVLHYGGEPPRMPPDAVQGALF